MRADIVYRGLAKPMCSLAKRFLIILEEIENGESELDASIPEKIFGKTPKMRVEQGIADMRNFDFLRQFEFDDFCRSVKVVSDFIGNCNNTILFRNFVNDKGREICYINKKIGEANKVSIEDTHNHIRSVVGLLRPDVRFIRRISNVGNLPRMDDSQMVIKSDISAFFRSVKFENLMKELPKVFRANNLEILAEEVIGTDETNVYGRLEVLIWAFMGCLFHNGVVPTGSKYAVELAQLHLLSTIYNHFDRSLARRGGVNVWIYVDDLIICGKREIVKEFYRELEKSMNAGGLYLNYKKVQYFYPDQGEEYSALGVRVKGIRGAAISRVNAKARKKCLDIIKERREYTPQEKGIIEYALRFKSHTSVLNPDILYHTYFDDKNALWEKLKAGELPLRCNKDIYDISNMSYKEFIMANRAGVTEMWSYSDSRVSPPLLEFIDMFLLDNSTGYKCLGRSYEEREDLAAMFMSLGRVSATGLTRKKAELLIELPKAFVESLYIGADNA